MSFDELKSQLPSYAKDIKLNLSSLLNEDILTDQQVYGCLLATALASGNEAVIQAAQIEATAKLSAEAQEAAKGAHAIMAMNNIYYKFVGFMEGSDYQTMQAKLRMNIIGNPGVDRKDFELWSLAVSAINGCKFCVTSHEQQLVKEGLSKEQMQAAVRIASVVHATARILGGEDAVKAGGADQAQAA